MFLSPHHMKIHRARHWSLVLAAGDGTRLQNYVERLKGSQLPKQFVNFFGPRSLIEHTYKRVEKLTAPEKILTIVGKHHFEHDEVRRQLAHRDQDTIIVQPSNKETGPGILLPLMHIYKRAPDAIVSVYPSDHFILESDRFMEHVELATKAVAHDPSRIVLLATEPQGPEVEYGYIVPCDNLGDLNLFGTKPVARFIEKPAKDVAGQLIDAGGLWNTMVMVFQVRTVIEMFERIQPVVFQRFRLILHAIGTPHELDTVEQVYRHLQPINFSKGFLERVTARYPRAIHVMPVLQVFWSDWGSRQRILDVRRTLKQASRPKPDTRRADVQGLALPSLPRTQTGQSTVHPTTSIPHDRKPWFAAIAVFFAGLIMLATAQVAGAQAIKSKEKSQRVAVIEKLMVKEGVVSGELLNKSANLLRDVQLFIRYTWLWDDEMKPGKTDPGTSVFYTLPKEIPPRGRLSFTFKPEPTLPRIAGGHFETTATVAAFSEVIQQQR